MSNPTLNLLQQQLAALQQTTATAEPQQTLTTGVSKEEVKALISQVLSEELGALKQQLGAVVQPKLTLMQALGSVIAVEDQQWLSQPATLNALPDYIISEAGAKQVTEFVQSFRRQYES